LKVDDLVSVFPKDGIIHSEYFYFSHTYELRTLALEGKPGLTVTVNIHCGIFKQ